MDLYVIDSIFLSFILIFFMELGDKTQLTSFTLTIRYKNRKKVFFGVSLGLIVVTSIGVLVGLLVKQTIKLSFLKPLTGILFFLFGIFIISSILRRHSSDEKDEIICPVSLDKCSTKYEDRKSSCSDIYNCKIFINNVTSKNAFYKSFSLIFLAELGDKTMITAITLTSTPQMEFLGVFIGASLALIVVNGLGIFFGHTILNTTVKDYLEPVSGGLFIVIAVVLIFF